VQYYDLSSGFRTGSWWKVLLFRVDSIIPTVLYCIVLYLFYLLIQLFNLTTFYFIYFTQLLAILRFITVYYADMFYILQVLWIYGTYINK
jgi:hypothetical protein